MEANGQQKGHFDVVIVGGGVAGAIIAHKLTRAGKRVLVLEAGTIDAMDPSSYRSYVDQFYRMGALRGTANGPYPINPDALSPGTPSSDPYYIQRGPQNFMSDYLRTLGGSTLHWQGTCLRFVPNDFQMQSLYGRGADWPISYDDLEQHYGEAEKLIGVSANVEDQANLGVWFPTGYEYPMRRLPPSMVDQFFSERLSDTRVELAGEEYPVRVVSIPVDTRSSMLSAIVIQETAARATPVVLRYVLYRQNITLSRQFVRRSRPANLKFEVSASLLESSTMSVRARCGKLNTSAILIRTSQC
jgi:choline dehydrogenase-like flavoprotein